MSTGSNQRKVVQGVAWASVASWGGQLLGFIIYAGLARLLSPEAFGLVAIAGVYIAFIQLLVAQGFGMAIVQREQIEDSHLDSAFWIAIAFALILCVLSHVFGPQIGRFFGEPRVAPVIGWLSFSLFFHAMSSIQMAILTRKMDFRALAIRTLLATLVGGAVGLIMAFRGWGVWSLVGQQLTNAIMSSLFMWWSVTWRPALQISRQHLRDLYKFSLNLTGTDVLWFFAQKSDQTMVGYGFGPLGLGPYSLASRLPTLLHDGIILPLQSVAFPSFSKLQSEPERFEQALLKFCELSSFVLFPVFFGLIAIAPSLVPLLFGVKWLAAVPLLQVLAAYGAARSALGFMHPLMLSKGRAGLYLAMNIILAALTLFGCFVTVHLSPLAIAVSIVVTMLLFGAVFLTASHRTLQLKIRPLLGKFVFPLFSSLLMLVIVFLARRFMAAAYSQAITVTVCVAIGVMVYGLSAYVGRPDLTRAFWELVGNNILSSRRAADESMVSGRSDRPPNPAPSTLEP
jgi:O-antigen/teichoic acid export membrane protein